MSRADVLQRVQDLSVGQADPTVSGRYLDEVILELGQAPILVNATLIAVGPGLGTPPDDSYLLPLTAVLPLQFFFDDSILPELSLGELLQWDQDWRARTGRPIGVYRMDPGLRRFRLVPLPDAPSSSSFMFLFGAPFGADFPDSVAAVLHTETRQDVPLWLEPSLAWFILAREFSRESDHTNPMFASHCAQLAQAELEMIR